MNKSRVIIIKAHLFGTDNKCHNLDNRKINKTWVIKDIFLKERTFELGFEEQGMIVIRY